MKKLEKILREVRRDVMKVMEETILSGGKHFTFEKQYGDAYIDIDFWETCNFPWLHAEWDIAVSHEDIHKRSPILEDAIKAVMPDWFKLKELLEMQQTA